jgi:hypothetical protein
VASKHATPLVSSPPKATRSARLWRWARVLWASPNTLIGLLGCALWWCAGARFRVVDGALEAALLAPRRTPPRRRSLPFTAITLGHVILGTHAQDLERLRAHEQVHVRQNERWGPLFLPAYALAGLWQWVQGRSAYWDNPFEVEARRMGGC